MLNPFYPAFALILALVGEPAIAATEPVKPDIIAVRNFVGSVKGNYFRPNTSTSEQIWDGLSLPDEPSRLPNGLTFNSGCRPHSCTEKAAVVSDQSGRIIAAALINFHCRRIKSRGTQCDDKPTLTIFRRKYTKPVAVDAIVSWSAPYRDSAAIEFIKM